MAATFVSIGECMVELSEAGKGLYAQGFAGDTLNTAWYVRALSRPADLRVRYMTAVGDDAISDDMAAFMAGAGLDVGLVRRLEGSTVGLYMIRLTGAERSFMYWRSASAARRLADDPAALAAGLADATAVHFSGITLAILPEHGRSALLDAVGAVKARGGLVAFDPNLRPRLWSGPDEMRRWTEAGYRAATIALPTFPDDRDLFGDPSIEACAERVAALGAAEVVVKDGADPALVMAGGTAVPVPAEAVSRPVDTTGAGDSFGGGYIAGRLRGLAPAAAAALGHRVAARVVQVKGALMAMDGLADL